MDVDRFPGGDHSKFKVSCRACHSNMDGLRPAFAKWTFSSGFAKNASVMSQTTVKAEDDQESLMYQSPMGVAGKFNQNATVFAGGYQVQTNAFVNNANRGANVTYFGWPEKLSGNGLNEFGQMIADAKAFPKCLTQRAFRAVCKREPASFDQPAIDKIAQDFASNGYKIRDLFERIAISPACLGGQ
jgi:hypothetical protein